MSMRNAIRTFALILALLPVVAGAQNFPNLPANSVYGRGAIPPQGGPGYAIPFSQFIASLLQSALTIPTINTSSVVFKGSTSGQATVQAQAAAGTPTILLPNTSGTLADSAVFPLALNSITGAMSCPTCSSQFVATRLAATALDLHAATVIQTGGYATAGDGGQATFKNVGTAPFVDSFITSFSITGGSGYTNGTTFSVFLANTNKPVAVGSATVSGGVVTALNIAGTPGGMCHVGDVYTTGSIPGGTGFHITVTGCSIPLGSFTDSVGTHWQLVFPGGGPNVMQFGAVGD